DALVGEPRVREGLAERREPAGAIAGLLLELAPRARLRALPRLERPRRHLPQLQADDRPELAEEDHAPVGEERHDGRDVPVADRVERGVPAVGEPVVLAAHAEDTPAILRRIAGVGQASTSSSTHPCTGPASIPTSR